MEQVKTFLEKENVPCTAEIIKGIKGEETLAQNVLEYAKKEEGDLILVMTQQEVDFTQYFIGSSAQEIINISTIPVMSIIPSPKKDTTVFHPYLNNKLKLKTNMKPFKIEKILIPIDFSKTSLLAIEHGAFTAQLFKAELVLLHVVENHWERFSIVVPEMRIEAPDNLINLVEARLEKHRQILSKISPRRSEMSRMMNDTRLNSPSRPACGVMPTDTSIRCPSA